MHFSTHQPKICMNKEWKKKWNPKLKQTTSIECCEMVLTDWKLWKIACIERRACIEKITKKEKKEIKKKCKTNNFKVLFKRYCPLLTAHSSQCCTKATRNLFWCNWIRYVRLQQKRFGIKSNSWQKIKARGKSLNTVCVFF